MSEDRSVAWISPPGDTVADLLEEHGWSKSELAQRLGCTPKHVSQLLGGIAPIHPPMAAALSRVLGSTPEFWLEREARYRAALERKERVDQLADEEEWLAELPLSWMVKEGFARRYHHAGEQVEEVLGFFGVASVAAWQDVYGARGTAFRTSASFGRKPGAVATWLRVAELAASRIACAPWSSSAFRTLLPHLRALTLQDDPASFEPKLREACASCGVAVALVRAPPGCPASGATQWLTPEKALLVLSARHKSNDHLWFTFFHEAAHLLLHSKKLAFLEGMDGLDPDLEGEADAFARNLLIPERRSPGLAGLRSPAAVRRFAAELGIHPGIVVGRLQRDGVIPWSHMNELKLRYSWADEV